MPIGQACKYNILITFIITGSCSSCRPSHKNTSHKKSISYHWKVLDSRWFSEGRRYRLYAAYVQQVLPFGRNDNDMTLSWSRRQEMKCCYKYCILFGATKQSPWLYPKVISTKDETNIKYLSFEEIRLSKERIII